MFHIAHGGRMIDFADYALPLQYRRGGLAEHQHTRALIGLFDVSHMGQARLGPRVRGTSAATYFERICPSGITTLDEGQARYTVLTNEAGGIIDDLIVSRFGNTLWLVVNGARQQVDFAHIEQAIGADIVLERATRVLLAIQGPKAATLVDTLLPTTARLHFMSSVWHKWRGADVLVNRCGYTGEDGFEISLPVDSAQEFADAALASSHSMLCGLGARDSLRLEAGLCLYGQDIDTTTSPIEAGLGWTIPRHRRIAGDYLGADVLTAQFAHGVRRRRVGILSEGRAIARAGCIITDMQEHEIGYITSGGFAPSLKRPIAMGYVATPYTMPDTALQIIIRNQPVAARIVPLPFISQDKHVH